jgi:hypothetical protein
MSQNTQQSPRTGTALSISQDDDPLASVDTLKMIACPICRALFVPSDGLHKQNSTVLLETAFLDICRFCFRCQRPACPQCWNPVHHTCAACSEDARLPFRSPVPSLKGLVFFPPTPHIGQARNISFTCQRNGRFYQPEPAPSPKIEAAPFANKQETSGALPMLQIGETRVAAEAYPIWLQEVLGKKTVEQTAISLAATGELSGKITLIQAPIEAAGAVSHAHTINQSGPIALTQQQATPPASPALPPPQPMLPAVCTQDAADSQENEVLQDETEDKLSLIEHIENVLIVITSILLLAVISVIVLSIISPQINAFFLNFLHIDIRTEIAYLLQLRS